MALCKFSSEQLIDGYTMLDNLFIHQYLPVADEFAVKVYVYGLFQCKNITGKDNSIEGMSLALGVEQKEIIQAFDYWENLGVVRYLSREPLAVEYLPIKQSIGRVKKYSPEKYADFIKQLESLFVERILTQNELLNYVEIIEEYKIKPEAMIMIASYCINLKGGKVHSNYIFTVAKSWANEGVTTVEKVDEKLKDLESNTENMRQVFYELGLKSTPDWEDKQSFIKWNTSWGFDLESILYTAKMCKRRGGMFRLDSMLDNFYRLGLYTLEDIKEHTEYIKQMQDLARSVTKALGLYYEVIDPIVENYIAVWLKQGFDSQGIMYLAKYCMRRNIRTLESMNYVVKEFYDNGFIHSDAIFEYIQKKKGIDTDIKRIIETMGSMRNVNNSDRDLYRTWTATWGFEMDVLLYTAELSKGKSHSFAYMNQLLSTWHTNNIHSLEGCKKAWEATGSANNANSTTKQKLSMERQYTEEELDALLGTDNFDF